MARNWKVGEAVKAIKSGNKEDMLDIGRSFPLFANLAAQVNEAGIALLDCVPEYCTARKIESVLKGDVQESGDDDAAEADVPVEAEEVKKPAKKAPAKKKEEDELSSKSAKELYEMCKKAGLNVKPKQDKSTYIDALKNQGSEEDDWDDEEEEVETPKKPAKKAPAAPKNKVPEKKDDAGDADDDWDI